MRKRLFVKAGLGAIITLSCVTSAVADDADKSLRLSKDTLQCVIENADNYLALNKDPVLVFFDLCPKAEPSPEEFMTFATNSLPSIKVTDGEEAADVTRVAALRKSDIECLVRMNGDDDQTDNALEDEASAIIEISFEGCASQSAAKAP